MMVDVTVRDEQRGSAGEDRTVGLLLCAAGWAGGGVMSAVIFQGSSGATGGGGGLDPFVALVAGCLLVGPMVAAALLWRWCQVRMVSTVAALTAAGVTAAVPVIVGAHALVSAGLGAIAVVGFVALWGVALPVAVRAVIVRVEHPWLAGDDRSSAPRGWNELLAHPAISDPAPVANGPPASSSPRRPGPPVDDRLPPVRLPPR
jgi:hypothetical protein